ncbi:hypothetical protein EV183_002288 [Coemansia sp. RSA 2336]|nr:hypothetical protein EV183_002288 [Coemansia sp. RSA 2336]
MRRNTRALAKKTESSVSLEENGRETPRRRGRAAEMQNGTKAAAAQQWSGSTSPLSSLSTPASTVDHGRRSLRQQAQGKASQQNESELDEASGEEDMEAVSSLLSRAAEAIEGEENSDEETPRSTRLRAAAGRRRKHTGSQEQSAASEEDSGEAAGLTPRVPAALTNGTPRKRGRPSRQELEQRRLAEQAAGGQYLASTRGDMANGSANGHYDGDESSDDEEVEKDAAGEAKIDKDGYLQGGREFICPIFRSPFRRNKRRQYVLTMDCCRYMGARDSYMLFKQHPRMRRVETTQKERDLLADRMMIPKVTRFRPIALITARTAFREFGARIVKNGRYIVDDYWEEARRREAKHPEGTLVANMTVYQSVMAAQAAGMTPGSTRKARRTTTPLRSTSDSTSRGRPSTPTRNPPGMGSPGNGMMVSSWVQLEAQQRVQQQQMSAAGVQSPISTAVQMRAGGLTMANALQQQQQQQQQQQPAGMVPQGPSQIQLLQQADAPADSDHDEAAKLALSKPVFCKQRSRETAEAAFESVVATHRTQFAEDHGFVDGTPLIRSLAPSWPRATSLSNRLKQKRGGSFARSDSEEASDAGASEDLFGPMAYASGKMAREFNASVRLWREDNGCTWIDPHTGIRQVPASLQPTAIRVERVDADNSRWRRLGKTKIDPLVAFTDALPEEPSEDDDGARNYPLALLPGQFQATFPIHRTRFGQSYQQTMHSYSYHWMRQLASLQLQQQRMSSYGYALPGMGMQQFVNPDAMILNGVGEGQINHHDLKNMDDKVYEGLKETSDPSFPGCFKNEQCEGTAAEHAGSSRIVSATSLISLAVIVALF